MLSALIAGAVVYLLLCVIALGLAIWAMVNAPRWWRNFRARRVLWHKRLAAGNRAEAHRIAMKEGHTEQWRYHRTKATYHKRRAEELSR